MKNHANEANIANPEYTNINTQKPEKVIIGYAIDVIASSHSNLSLEWCRSDITILVMQPNIINKKDIDNNGKNKAMG